MKVNYEVKLSATRVEKKYLELMAEMNSHYKILIENEQPYISFRTIRQRITNERRNLEIKEQAEQREEITGELAKLIIEASEILEIDLYPAWRQKALTRQGLLNGIILHEYDRMSRNGLKYIKIKEELSERYGVSRSSIEKLVYKKTEVGSQKTEVGKSQADDI